MEPGEQGDAKEQQYARALGVLYEQAERGGVRAVMNIFLYALLGPSDHMRTMPTVATQKAVLRGLLFVSSLATSREYGGAERTDGGDGKGVEDTDGGERDEGGAECHKGGSEGGEADVGNSSLCGIRPGEATSNVSEMARASKVLSEQYLLETLLGLTMSDDSEVRHDALGVLTQISMLPRARSFLASPRRVRAITAITYANVASASYGQQPVVSRQPRESMINPWAVIGQKIEQTIAQSSLASPRGSAIGWFPPLSQRENQYDSRATDASGPGKAHRRECRCSIGETAAVCSAFITPPMPHPHHSCACARSGAAHFTAVTDAVAAAARQRALRQHPAPCCDQPSAIQRRRARFLCCCH